MIVSRRYRYVYVELPRTGSTAVQRALRDHYHGRQILRKHSTYRDFLRQASPEERSYFAFSGIRNPLDIAVSRYVNLKTNARGHFTEPTEIARRNALAGKLERRIYRWVQRTDATFEEFLLRWYRLPYDTWSSLDHRKLGAVLRFESLNEDFLAVMRQIGVKEEDLKPLPLRNVTPCRDRDWESYYTPRAIRRAAWVFGPYLREWGYSFPPQWGEVRVPWWSRAAMRMLRVVRGGYWRVIRPFDYTRKRPRAARYAREERPPA